MDTDDSYTIVFTNEMLRSIGINTDKNEVEVEVIIQDGFLKIKRKTNGD
jgi:hypothetical protein